jgi:hypothetical protein
MSLPGRKLTGREESRAGQEIQGANTEAGQSYRKDGVWKIREVQTR